MTIRSSVETITPADADKLLTASKDHVRNRSVADGHVSWLADQIRHGKWRTNGEPIILDEDGYLLDGQHRLYAIIMSEKSIETVVTRGVERSTFATIDTGSARTTANVMSIDGEANATTLASVLGWIHRYESSKMLTHIKAAGFTSAIALAALKKNSSVRDDVAWAVNTARANVFLKKVSGSGLAFLKYVFGQHKPNKATEFFELIGDLRPDEHGTPTRVLRDWLIRNDRDRVAATPLETLAVFVKAWSAFLNGERPKTYVWRRTTAFPESFPIFPGDKESRGKAIRATGARKDKVRAERKAAKNE